MAAFDGRDGTIVIGTYGFTLNCTRWSIDTARGAYDSTAWPVSNNARTFVGGLWAWAGSASGYLDDTTDVNFQFYTTDSAFASFVFTATSGVVYTGNCITTSFNFGSAVDALGEWSSSFQGSGVLTAS